MVTEFGDTVGEKMPKSPEGFLIEPESKRVEGKTICLDP